MVEYVFVDENPFIVKERPTGSFGPFSMRTGMDKLCYGTGIAYLTGLGYGGVYGTYRGLKTAKLPSFKIRLNNVLNQVARYGTWAGNSWGVMAMTWAVLDNSFGLLREGDYYNHVGAAFCAGALFKSTAGLRPALVTGAVLSGFVASFGLFDRFILAAPQMLD